MYTLFHPCECNGQFIRTDPEGLVHINWLLYEWGVITDLFPIGAFVKCVKYEMC